MARRAVAEAEVRSTKCEVRLAWTTSEARSVACGISSDVAFVLRTSLLFDRFFGAVDDQRLDRTSLRVELQAELFLDGGEERRTVGIHRRQIGRARRTLRHLIRSPGHRDVVVADQPCAIEHDP